MLNVLDRHTIGRLLRSRDIAAWGVAANDPRLDPLAPDLPTAVTMLMRLDPAVLRALHHGPTDDYREEHRRVNAALDAAAATLTAALREHGHRAEAIPATVTTTPGAGGHGPGGNGDGPGHDDRGHGHDAPFPHKTAATQAGLGWIGKTALFVSNDFGPAVRLATVFTDLSLPVGTPILEGRCGDCRACIDACPAGCGRDVRWRAGMPLSRLFDAAACRHHMAVTYGESPETVCGICIAACPLSQA
ncbi:MAG: epoxyqueuosine reductase [Thermoleophilia bacterium]|nr:epoxyqueuosine reductase [Thermoleophilia bacterium]